MPNVILIGGSGYLGSNVLASLKNTPYRIIAVRNSNDIPESDDIDILEGGITALTADVLKRIKPDIVFHCGRPTYSRLRKLGRKIAAAKAYKLNSQLIENIKSSLSDTKIVFASGSLAYGNSYAPHDEASSLNPISYSRQYVRGELPLLKAVNNTKVILLRFPWLLGNGSWFRWFYLNNILSNNQIPLFGAGSNIMSLIDVEDAANLMISYGESNYENGIFNIFSDSQIKQLSFAETISKVFECNIVPFDQIYPKLEKAAHEAFLSNIELGTEFGDILEEYSYTSIIDTLKRIKSQSGL